MFADDRVLVAFVPNAADFQTIENESWYRIPHKHAPKGLHAEWIAFYFGRKFADQKHAIHYYARNLGHELMTRRELIPAQPTHPRADDVYYKIQLGPLHKLEQPIVSLRWRRILFLHTTGDRFQDATEINDLFIDGDQYVNRVQTSLREDETRPYAVLREENHTYENW